MSSFSSKSPNWNWLLIIALLATLLFQLFSCRTPDKLVETAVKRGYEIPNKERIVTVEVTLKGVNGEDSVVNRLVKVNCPDLPVVKTWWAELQETRRLNDSLKYATRNNRIDSREAKAIAKSDNKAETKQAKSADKTETKIHKQDKKTERQTKGTTFWDRLKNWLLIISLLLNVVLLVVIYFRKLKGRFLM